MVPEEAAPVALSRIFLQGVLSSVLNPKVALFFPAFLSQFADPGVGALGLLTLGMTFALLTLAVFSPLGFFSGGVGDWLGGGLGFANTLRWLTGSVLIGLGLRLALPETGS